MVGVQFLFLLQDEKAETDGDYEMRQVFMCSLCHNGILGGGLYLDHQAVTFRTQKLTVDEAYRNLILPLKEITEISWKWIVFPVAAFHMKNGQCYKLIIFNPWRFQKYIQPYMEKPLDSPL